MSLGHKIKRLRKLKGVSLERLSQLTGMSQTELVSIEMDQSLPTPLQLRQVALVLGEDGYFTSSNIEFNVQHDDDIAANNILSFDIMKKCSTPPLCVYVIEQDPLERMLMVDAVRKHSNLVYDFDCEAGVRIFHTLCHEKGADLNIPHPNIVLLTPEQFDKDSLKNCTSISEQIQVYAFLSHLDHKPCSELTERVNVIDTYLKPMTESDTRSCIGRVMQQAAKIMTG